MDNQEPSPEALRAATALIVGGKNEDPFPTDGAAYVAVDDLDGNCLLSDTTVPKLDGLEESLAAIRRKVAIVIDKYMNQRK